MTAWPPGPLPKTIWPHYHPPTSRQVGPSLSRGPDTHSWSARLPGAPRLSTRGLGPGLPSCPGPRPAELICANTHVLTSTHMHACTYKHTDVHTCLHACTHIFLPSGSRWVWPMKGPAGYWSGEPRGERGWVPVFPQSLPAGGGLVGLGSSPHVTGSLTLPCARAACSLSWELVGNANSQAPPTPTEPEAGPSGDSCALMFENLCPVSGSKDSTARWPGLGPQLPLPL